MFQVLVEINHFTQLSAVEPELAGRLVDMVNTYVRDYGASLKNTSPGQMVLEFRLQRHSDTSFIVAGLLGLATAFNNLGEGLYGYSMIIDDGHTDEEGIRRLRRSLLALRATEGLWVGPAIRDELTAFVELDEGPGLSKVVRVKESGASDFSQLHDQYLRVPEATMIRQFLGRGLSGPVVPARRLAVLSENDPGIAALVQEMLLGLIGTKAGVLWIPGQDVKDPPSLALTRGIYPQALEEIERFVAPDERSLWDLSKNFLFLSSRASIVGLNSACVPPQDPDTVFGNAFRIFFHALTRQSNAAGRPLVVHVDRYANLHDAAKTCINHLMTATGQSGSPADVSWVFSGVLGEELPPGIAEQSICLVPGLNLADPAAAGIDLANLGGNLASLRQGGPIGRRYALLLGLLASRPSVAAADAPRPTGAPLTAHGIRRIILLELLASLDPVLVETLCVCAMSFGFLSVEESTLFLESLAIERIRVPGLFRQLHLLGLIRDEELCLPASQDTLEICEAFLGDKADDIRKKLCRHVVGRITAGHLLLKLDLVLLLKELGAIDEFFQMLDRYTRDCLDAGDLGTVRLLLEHGAHSLKEVAEPGQRRDCESLLTYLEARTALESGNLELAARMLASFDQASSPWGNKAQGYLHVLKGRLLFLREGIDASLPWIKRGIMDFQESGELKGLSDAQRVFGHVMFARERVNEAREYFILSRNNAADQKLLNEELWAELHENQANFILGYHTRVIANSHDSKSTVRKALDAGKFQLAGYLDFLRGRSFFELGMYDEAVQVWETCMDLSRLAGTTANTQLFVRWMARARLYQGGGEELIPELLAGDCPEGHFLLAEARQMWGDHAAALKLLTPEVWPSPVRHLPEDIRWDTGYAFLEDRLFMEQGFTFMARLAKLMRLHSMASCGDTTEACRQLSMFNRNLKKGAMDPCIHWYLYLQADSIGRSSDVQNEDKPTVLGKAIKFLQERASRLENPQHKKNYLGRNVWNRRLLEQARQFNLS